eukprot:NODE_149_length_15530_cov_0.274448.p3 type:complete len:123 gc:universal NODE_149_length_15530_cov_0.274448:12479-12847(+)
MVKQCVEESREKNKFVHQHPKCGRCGRFHADQCWECTVCGELGHKSFMSRKRKVKERDLEKKQGPAINLIEEAAEILADKGAAVSVVSREYIDMRNLPMNRSKGYVKTGNSLIKILGKLIWN